MSRNSNTALNVKRKNWNKVIKSIIQLVILFALGIVLFNTTIHHRQYVDADRTAWTSDQGFIAISYSGVGRSSSSKLITKEQLNEELGALYDQGYRTISQQDIINYYVKSSPLPNKALFLAFEDGSNDSHLFAQSLLEQYNFKATFMTHANKIDQGDRKFVQPAEMKKMVQSGFWELGSNGYRIAYINMFDQDGRYIGANHDARLNKKQQQYSKYNHYLTDFIRDENMIPLETRDQMEARINTDYAKLKKVYTETIGYVPQLYMIMHANAMDQMNRLVYEANSVNIQELFQIHFSREGASFNTRNDDIYNLTRIRPDAEWSTNHLLMSIRKETGQLMQFVQGNEQAASKWNTLSGVAQFVNDSIILTTPPAASGKIYLKGTSERRDLKLTLGIAGNNSGEQSVYVRYDRRNDSFVQIKLNNGIIMVTQKRPQSEPELLFEEAIPVNLGEDERQEHLLEITMNGNRLGLTVNNKVVLDKQEIDSKIRIGGVMLEAKSNVVQENNDIYDGIFNELVIHSPGSSVQQSFKYSLKPKGIQWVLDKSRKAVNSVVDWAMETF